VHSLPVVLGSVPFNWLSLHSHFRSDAALGPSLSFLVTAILQNTHFGPEICEFQNALLVFGSYSWVESTGYIQGPSRGPGTPYSLGPKTSGTEHPAPISGRKVVSYHSRDVTL